MIDSLWRICEVKNAANLRVFGFQLEPDPNSMMSMMDNNMFGHYEGLPMTLDDADTTLSQSYTPMSILPKHPSSTSMSQMQTSNDQTFAGEKLGADGSGDGGNGQMTLSANIGGAAQSSMTSSNTLTEFTKRRNWSAKVVEELQDLLQILDANGRIKYVSPSIQALTGHKSEETIDCFLRDFIHPDDCGVFVSELNESIASGNPLRLFYRFRKKDGTYAIFESVGHAHIAAAKFAPNPNNQTPFCQAVFMMSRPYPTKNAGLLDSFLEHKIENERLQRRIQELQKEEEVEAEESQRNWRQSQEGHSDITPSDDFTGSGATPFRQNPSPDSSMPPPERPVSLNIALTRENLEGIAGSRPDSIRDKMARYAGGDKSSTAETIEMLTGLRYQEGERSRGITTGNASPTLIKGDAGIAIPLDRDPRTGEKKKKPKVAEEYVCTDCGEFHLGSG
jgi:PAS domain S-box-containing protein